MVALRFKAVAFACYVGLYLLSLPVQAQQRPARNAAQKKAVSKQLVTDGPLKIYDYRDSKPKIEVEWVEVEPVQTVQYVEESYSPALLGPDNEAHNDDFFLPYQLSGPGTHSCDSLACNVAGCRRDTWVRANYLYWYLDGTSLPPLITTSPAGTSRGDAGVLGLSTTSVLLGNETIGDEGLSGAQIEAGHWFKSRGGLGIHLAYFQLEDAQRSEQYDDGTIAILARPFFSVDPADSGPNSELIAFPNEVTGNVAVSMQTSFEGAEIMMRKMIVDRHHGNLQFLAGFQYAGLDDDLRVDDFKRVTGASSGLAIGTTLRESDRFRTENKFRGVALGVLGSARNCGWSVDAGMQLAIGSNRMQTRIDGSTTSSVPTAGGGSNVVTTAGGLLTLPSNLGAFDDEVLAVLPQLHVGLAYALNPQTRAMVGYRFLYWSQVARAADQIDTGVNLSQLDPGGLNGEGRPRFDFIKSDFWAQGINVGLDYRY